MWVLLDAAGSRSQGAAIAQRVAAPSRGRVLMDVPAALEVVRMKEPETLAQRILHLEQQLESYARLHAEELAEMRKTLQSLKDALLSHYQQQRSAAVALDDEAIGNGQRTS
jgi:hypothetical protein